MSEAIDTEKRIKKLEAELEMLRSQLADCQTKTDVALDAAGKDETRRALLHMLRDVEEGQSQLERAKKEWADAFDAIDDPVFIHDGEFRIVRANRAFAVHAGMNFQEIIGQPYWEVFPKMEGPLATCKRSLQAEEDEDEDEEVIALGNGELFNSRAFAIHDTEGHYIHSIHILENITQRKKMEQALQHENRARRIISASNSTLIHAREELPLLKKICSLITTDKDFPLAWVGLKQDDEIHSINIAALDGAATLEELQALGLSWDDSVEGYGPAGIAIRTGELQLITDIEQQAHCPACQELAQKYGYHSIIAFPLLTNSTCLGALTIAARAEDAFSEQEIELLQELADDIAYGIVALRSGAERDHAEQERIELLDKLEGTLNKTVQAMASAVEARDPYTAGHQRHVATLAVEIAKEMELSENEVEGIRIAATIHDLGKITVPAEILSKPGKITDIEFAMIKVHSQVGYDILKDIDFPWPVAEMVLQHHERLDGSGYPQGLHEDEIIFGARIIAVADVTEAIASHRPYRAALGIDFALEQLEKGRGSHFDPDVVDACIRLFREQSYQFDLS